MKVDKLIEAIGMTKESYVEDAKAHTLTAHRISFKKAATLIAAVILCLSLSVSALAAAGYDPVYRAIYSLSPTLAQALVPIRLSDTDNGIQMEVVSAYIENDTANIVIAMRDLTGNRVDETMDLYDSYRINRAFDSTGTCSALGYDEETGTATFLITLSQWGEREITGDKITFYVREFLSRKTTFEDALAIDLTAVPTVTQTAYHECRYVEPAQSTQTVTWQEPCLIPDGSCEDFTSGIDLTGYGYIDGKFHIQVAIRDRLQNDNHGTFYLTDGNGNRRYCDYTVDWTDHIDDIRIDYFEYVFDIPPESIDSYQLYAYFITSDGAIKGDWQVTFTSAQGS